jgi:hypothetical protein
VVIVLALGAILALGALAALGLLIAFGVYRAAAGVGDDRGLRKYQ